MKIYEIGTGYTPIPAQMSAATEIVVEELTKAFLAQGINVEIVDICSSKRAPHQLPITEVKVPSVFSRSDVRLGLMHKMKRMVYSLALAFKLKAILKASDEKVVLHFHNQYNMFFYLLCTPRRWRAKAVAVYTNHNGVWNLPWEQAEGVLKKRYFQEIACVKAADMSFVLNANTKENMTSRLGVAGDRVVRIGNGVNTNVYTPLSKERIAAIKERYHLDGKRVILQVGSVNENKGQGRSLEWLADLLHENRDLVFAYAGDVVSQEYFDEMTAAVKELGLEEQVRYLGTVSPGAEINELYNMASATIFSSRYEGFPLVCIESLSAGVPVLICSDLPLDFGDGCISCSVTDFRSVVTEQILADDARAVLSARARANAVNNHTWARIARDYRAAMESVF